jgi:xanthine dehydrogenase accessory factor
LGDGAVRGTVGGGRLEYEATKKAKDNFASGMSFVLHFDLTVDLTGTGAANSDKMICGGVADVYVEYLSPKNNETCLVFKRVSDMIREGKKGVLFTPISEGIASEDTSCRAFLGEDGSLTGAIYGLPMNEQSSQKWLKSRAASMLKIEGSDPKLFIEPVEPDEVIYIFGAGHISTCLAQLAKTIGFRVVVADDRAEFCNSERFPQADELLVMPFSEVFERIAVTYSSYLAIVTRGHVHDLAVLRETLRYSPAYIGMIGSKSKINTVYELLLEEGMSKASLEKVHAPIGLDIGAETPEEIAVAIVAEMIQVRAGLRKGF